MNEKDSTYLKGRASIYDRVYRRQIQLEVAVAKARPNEEVLMPLYDDRGQKIGTHPIDTTFLVGHRKIVRSVESDLEREGAGDVVIDIATSIEKEFFP